MSVATITSNAITAIADETIAQLEITPLLSGHPLDDQAFGSDLYLGRAGVFWTIHYLQTVGAINSTFDITPHLEAALEQNRQCYQIQHWESIKEIDKIECNQLCKILCKNDASCSMQIKTAATWVFLVWLFGSTNDASQNANKTNRCGSNPNHGFC